MPQADDSYNVFTTRFDKVVSLAKAPPRPAHERAWLRFMEDTLELRTAWEVVGSQKAAELRQTVDQDALGQTLVTLLVDQSGSMRGARMLMAAAAADVARAFLVHLGVSVETLGFTTRSWKGGWSRRLWRLTGRRRSPGRLCDLLHLVYSEAKDRRPGTGRPSLAHMLDPGLLKENVDGEALLWAADRQDQCSHKHKVLVLISDGAPVDDSTLHANGSAYLMNHLIEVVTRLQETRALAQLQLGDETKSCFEVTRRVHTLPDIGPALIALLGDTLRRQAVAPEEAA